jgi:hypothetical protein
MSKAGPTKPQNVQRNFLLNIPVISSAILSGEQKEQSYQKGEFDSIQSGGVIREATVIFE